MTDERDPEASLNEWKETMQDEHADAIENPDPDADHQIEGVTQINYRVYYEYDAGSDELVRAREEQVDDLTDPELRSCACGVRGMTPEESRQHVRRAHELS